MRKVQVVNEADEIEYPCLMESNDGEIIVDFKAEGCGYVIGTKTIRYSVYEYSTLFNMSDFKPFKGKVIIGNDL